MPQVFGRGSGSVAFSESSFRGRSPQKTLGKRLALCSYLGTMGFSGWTSPFPQGQKSSPANICLQTASQLPLFYVSSWEDTPQPNDTWTPGPEHLPSQRAQIDVSEQSASQENTLSEADTLVPDDASLRSTEQGEEWRQAGKAAEREAASSALAAALYDAEQLHNARHSAFVLGPYGRPPDLARFGIVLLIVEDIGIARVFSLIQTLVLASEQHRGMVRKLVVVWQMGDLDNRRWVNMQHLLDLDRQEFQILRFVLYYRRNCNHEPSRNPGTRIRFRKGSVDVAQTIRRYLNTRRGSILVGGMDPLRGRWGKAGSSDEAILTDPLSPVCARQSIRNQVRAIVQPKLSDDLRLLDLDVEPYHQWLGSDSTVADTTGPSRNHLQWIGSRITEGRDHSR
ncbi:hypothetical protein AnigIFM59636_002467 [Aspergillus niger]|nr:hypothetical protein AnigIFM59636_002467 [Aspergillus niger]